MEIDTARLARVLDQQEITDVIHRYCRGIDRRDYDLVRACYHPDASDDHGDFRGGVDAFIDYVQGTLPRFEHTMHFIGNVLVEPVGDRARAESYAVAHHHMRASSSKPERDLTVGLRYVDDFERRAGQWRIAARACAFEWWRYDLVAPNPWRPGDAATIGRTDATDVVFAPSIATWRR
jgi:ketosteroid isomerase-like protein